MHHVTLGALCLQTWLQAFAWSESSKPKCVQARLRASADLPAMQQEPMFCFETAVSALYWSQLAYLYASAGKMKEVIGTFSSLNVFYNVILLIGHSPQNTSTC